MGTTPYNEFDQKSNQRGRLPMSDSLYKIGESYARYSLTDAAYEKIMLYLPEEKSTGRPGMDVRLFWDALIFVVREGCSWRSIPEKYGKWNSIYKKFRLWVSQGVFQKIYMRLIGLYDETAEDIVLIEKIYYAISIDSTSNKVHQHATGARKDAAEADSKQHIGTSRGGPNTKIHALVNDDLEMVAFDITGGQVHDSQMAIPLLDSINIGFVYFNADMAYGTTDIRNYIKNLNSEMVCPNRSNAKTIHEFNKEEYKGRNVVERYFQKIKCFRRIATRYDKLACVYRAFVHLASILIKIGNKTRERELRKRSTVDRQKSSWSEFFNTP
jgi:transposase